MLIDAGGAEFRQSLRQAGQSVTVTVEETHDGVVCDCVDAERTLHVGDEVVLTHVCTDGRVDKVVARVVRFN